MKTKRIILSVALGPLLFLSCDLGGTLSEQQVAQRARDLVPLLPAIQSVMELEPLADPASRALTPSQVGLNDNINPYDTWVNAGGSSAAALRFPANATSYYTLSNGDQCYFTLRPESSPPSASTKFRIKLYTYPAASQNVAYVYEEYLVDSTATWAWGNLGSNGQTGWIKYETYYADGTVGSRTIVNDSNNLGPKYAPFTVVDPRGSAANLALYLYSGSVPAQTTTTSGIGYSSQTSDVVTLKNGSATGTSFYTETSAGVQSGVTYSTINQGAWSDPTYVVSRFTADPAAGTRLGFAVTTYNANAWKSQFDTISVSKQAGTFQYVFRSDLYDMKAADAINASPSTPTTNIYTLATVPGTPYTYSGSLKTYWGATGNEYAVSVVKSASNNWKVSSTWTSSISRATGSGPTLELEVTKASLSAMDLALPQGGNFRGGYSQGQLVGILVDGANQWDVVVTNFGAVVNGTLHPFKGL